MIDKHSLAFCAALGATGVEVFCVYDGLRDAAGAQIAAGVAIAVLAPLVPAYIEGARRYFATVVFVFALACVIVASGSRVGASVDHAQQQRDLAERASKVAAASERELSAMLAEARAAQAAVCTKPTRTCTDAAKDVAKRVDDLQARLLAARTTLATAPIVAGEGDVARVAAWTGGYLSEHQVRLYLPLLWPVTMALVGAFFWGVWGDGRPKAPVAVAAEKPSVVEPAAPPVTPTVGNVPEIPADMLKPAKGRRVEIGKVFAGYAARCEAAEQRVMPPEDFIEPARRFCRECGIRTQAVGERIYLVDVQLGVKVARLEAQMSA